MDLSEPKWLKLIFLHIFYYSSAHRSFVQTDACGPTHSLSHCVVWVQIYFCYFAATIVGTSAEKRFGRRIVAAAVAAVDPSSTNDDKDGDERLCIELSPSMRCCPFHIYYYYIDSVAHMRLHFCCYCCCCCEMCRRFGSYFSHGRWCNCNCMWYQWYLHKVHHSRPTKT